MAFQYGRVAEIADGRGIGAALGTATVGVYAQGEADGNILLGGGTVHLLFRVATEY